MRNFIFLALLLASCAQISRNELVLAGAFGLKKDDLVYIKKITKDKIEEFIINPGLFNKPDVRGIKVYASFENSENVRESLRVYFRDRGYLVFLTGQYNNYRNKKNELGIFKTRDQYDIIRIQNTGKGRKNKNPELIIEQLKKWESRFKFEVTGAQSFMIQAKFITKPADITKFTEELIEFCPEILNDGSGKIEDIISGMNSTNSFFLIF